MARRPAPLVDTLASSPAQRNRPRLSHGPGEERRCAMSGVDIDAAVGAELAVLQAEHVALKREHERLETGRDELASVRDWPRRATLRQGDHGPGTATTGRLGLTVSFLLGALRSALDARLERESIATERRSLLGSMTIEHSSGSVARI